MNNLCQDVCTATEIELGDCSPLSFETYPLATVIYHPAYTPSDKFPYRISTELWNQVILLKATGAQASIFAQLLPPGHRDMSNSVCSALSSLYLSLCIPCSPETVPALLNLLRVSSPFSSPEPASGFQSFPDAAFSLAPMSHSEGLFRPCGL